MFRGKINFQEENVQSVTFREFLSPFLYEIDFLSMLQEELLTIVAQENIFTEEEILAILMTSKSVSGEFSEYVVADHKDDALKSANSNFAHKDYPLILRSKPKRRRLNFPDALLRTFSIISYMKCDYKTKWLPTGVYIFLNLQASEDIYIKQIKARNDCFLGEAYLDVKDAELGGIITSSGGPPWVFNNYLSLKRNVSYMINVRGKGRICKHEFVMFSTNHLNIEFCGEAALCDISIKYFV